MERILAVLAVAALLAAPCRAGEAPRQDAGWLGARVEMSDGQTLSGQLKVPNDLLLLYSPKKGRRYSLRLGEIRRVVSIIEKQAQQPKWFFRESGRDEKVYTGEHYPVRYYATRVEFTDGRMLTGHLLARTIYLRTAEGTQRLVLRRKQEGEVGQRPDDLVYVRVLEVLEGRGVRGEISGTLKTPQGEELKRVVALNTERGFGLAASLRGEKGRFVVEGCTEGTYDLIAVTNRAIYTYFSAEDAEDARRLHAGAVADVQSCIDKLKAFFQSQRVVYAAGNEDRTFALVFQERRGGTTLPGLNLLHRYEAWVLKRPHEQWQITDRVFVWRQLSRGEPMPPLRVVMLAALGGHRIARGQAEVALEVELKRTKEQPIPPSPPPKQEGDEG